MKTRLIALAMTVAVLSFNTEVLRAKDKPNKPKHGQKESDLIIPDGKSKPKDKDAHEKSAGGKISINHKGKVISVDEHALQAHLKHGDTIVSGGSVEVPVIVVPKVTLPSLPAPPALPGLPPPPVPGTKPK